MTDWQLAGWRAIAARLPAAGLTALADALRADDDALMQSTTAWPAGCGHARDTTPCEGACAAGYAAWKGEGLGSCGAVYDRFVEIMAAAGPGAWTFINWYDSTPRAAMRAALLPLAQAEVTARGFDSPDRHEDF